MSSSTDSSDERLEASRLYSLKFQLESFELLLLLSIPLKAFEGKVLRFEGILQTVVHLQLVRHHPRDVVIFGKFVPILADADDMVGRIRVGGRVLARLEIVVCEHGIVLHRLRRRIENRA